MSHFQPRKILKNKEIINKDEEIVIINEEMISKMDVFMNQFLTTFQNVNFDIIIDLPRLISLELYHQRFEEKKENNQKKTSGIEDFFMTILKKREERSSSHNILLITKSTMRDENKNALEVRFLTQD